MKARFETKIPTNLQAIRLLVDPAEATYESKTGTLHIPKAEFNDLRAYARQFPDKSEYSNPRLFSDTFSVAYTTKGLTIHLKHGDLVIFEVGIKQFLNMIKQVEVFE